MIMHYSARKAEGPNPGAAAEALPGHRARNPGTKLPAASWAAGRLRFVKILRMVNSWEWLMILEWLI